MKVEARAGISFYRYVEVEACLIGEGFEEGGNTAGAFLVEIGYGVGAVIACGRAVAEGEAVANKQDAFGRVRPLQRERAVCRIIELCSLRFRANYC